jgi:hypothetical protein
MNIMMDELMEADEWIEEEEWIEDSWMELEKARGEKLIKCTKKEHKKSKNNYNSLNELIIIFEDTDNMDIEETYQIRIKAGKIVAGKHDSKKSQFKEVDFNKLKGKRFLEYVAGQIGNMDSEIKLTLAFEKGYSIEISDYSAIEEYK